MADDKKFYRELKKVIKKTGNRKRRRYLKDHLDPEADQEFDFGYDESSALNGRDGRRRRKKKWNDQSESE